MSAPADLTNAELNAAIAREVMGWYTSFPSGHWHNATEPKHVRMADSDWSPATDIAAAFEVVERMREDTKLFGRFVRSLWHNWPDQSSVHENDALAGVWWLMMHITPCAICEAALAAVRSES